MREDRDLYPQDMAAGTGVPVLKAFPEMSHIYFTCADHVTIAIPDDFL
jgi:hypothetical protein